MNLTAQLHSLGQAARKASSTLATSSTEQKNRALLAMADQMLADEKKILEANEQDTEAAATAGLSPSMIDRLRLTPERITGMAEGIRTAAKLPDPVGKVLKEWRRPDGLLFQKITVPIGVIGIIYESRPNVTADAAILCLKAGNVCILRGGSEAFHSNKAIATSLQKGLESAGLPAASIQLVPVTDREAVQILCEMDEYLHCIIPRGGKGLIETVTRHARMPVIKHNDGICSAYVDEETDLAMAEKILLNAKCQRPSACNAIETVLLHRSIAPSFLKEPAQALLQAGVTLRCDEDTLTLLPPKVRSRFTAQIEPAREKDFFTEFLALILAVKIVDSLEEAIEHIESHGSHHSDLIITENKEHAEQFLKDVDSATVYWNASTRFTDGGEFGFGAEIGISTEKLHARGPMGLEELTSYKYLIRGTGQVRP
ncbi:MAG: glutamate-5-semialdehyde dehydrogenase [Chthoniobacterales bacterium]|nr:glutamate-5-semialdehyde dehydrogenase [Chthoniobacterales bacterium]